MRLLNDKIQIEVSKFDKLRPMMRFVYDHSYNKSELIIAEIGVYRGEHAKAIMDIFGDKIKMLYLVDPYEFCEVKYHNLKGSELIAKYKLYKYRKQITFIKATSNEAVDLIPDNMDAVYIDGCHDYEQVIKDISNYWNKVKQFGVIGGDDFTFKGFPDVPCAVIEFAKINKILPELCFGEKKDWWIRKVEFDESIMKNFRKNTYENTLSISALIEKIKIKTNTINFDDPSLQLGFTCGLAWIKSILDGNIQVCFKCGTDILTADSFMIKDGKTICSNCSK